jgi:integrase
MPKPRLRAGELGVIQILTLPSGRVQARALLCDELGATQRIKASGATAEEASAALRSRAATVLHDTGGPQLGLDATVAEACAVFLQDKRRSGTVEQSTLEVYEASIRFVIVPTCGDLLLRDFTVRRCNRILTEIKTEKSLSAARKARSVLSQVCATGIEWEILTANPVRDARRLPLPEKKTAVLTPGQLTEVQRLMRAWRAGEGASGPRPNVALLENAMWIMVGTSMRIGEVLALRRCDVDVTADPPTALVDATLRYDREHGQSRKPAPKRTRQRRRIALPSFTAAAVRHQLGVTETGPAVFLFATRTGRPLSVSNYERLLRGFVDDNHAALRRLGIDVDQFSTHIFRRSAATIVEAAAGITLASRLLGHANEQVTRASYVVSAEMVDPATAQILEAAFDVGA